MAPVVRASGQRRIEIHHDLIPQGAGFIERAAVRAVIRAGTRLLLVHSRVGGDYKFPGGGVEVGEEPTAALVREVLEECGRSVTHVGAPELSVIETRSAREPGWVLRSRSRYHPCSVDASVGALALDDYERELGFGPAWVDLDEAIAANESVLGGGAAQSWVYRETHVLR
ncbi:MAG: NUDIX domain-containing protein [Candidatus Nanopelagicales bacterium]